MSDHNTAQPNNPQPDKSNHAAHNRMVEPLISLYQDGEASPAERQLVEQYLNKCVDCRAIYQDYQQLIDQLEVFKANIAEPGLSPRDYPFLKIVKPTNQVRPASLPPRINLLTPAYQPAQTRLPNRTSFMFSAMAQLTAAVLVVGLIGFLLVAGLNGQKPTVTPEVGVAIQTVAANQSAAAKDTATPSASLVDDTPSSPAPTTPPAPLITETPATTQAPAQTTSNVPVVKTAPAQAASLATATPVPVTTSTPRTVPSVKPTSPATNTTQATTSEAGSKTAIASAPPLPSTGTPAQTTSAAMTTNPPVATTTIPDTTVAPTTATATTAAVPTTTAAVPTTTAAVPATTAAPPTIASAGPVNPAPPKPDPALVKISGSDYGWIAYVDKNDAQIHLVRADGSQDQVVGDPVTYKDVNWEQLAWSNDARWLAAVGFQPAKNIHAIFTIDIQNPLNIDLITEGVSPVWSPDSRSLSYLAGPITVQDGVRQGRPATINLKKRLVNVHSLVSENYAPQWFDTGDRLLLGDNRILDLTTNQITSFKLFENTCIGGSLSPVNNRLAVLERLPDDRYETVIYDLNKGEPGPKTVVARAAAPVQGRIGRICGAQRLQWTPDSRNVYYYATGSNGFATCLVSTAGGTRCLSNVYSPSFTIGTEAFTDFSPAAGLVYVGLTTAGSRPITLRTIAEASFAPVWQPR